MINTEKGSVSVMEQKNNCQENKKPISGTDICLGIFYLLIIAVGLSLLPNHGRNASVYHLTALAVSTIGIFVIKFSKNKKSVGEWLFSAILAVLAIFAFAAQFIF